jgi:hypothetical protein
MNQPSIAFFSGFPVVAVAVPRSWGEGVKGGFSPPLIDKIERETGFGQNNWLWGEQVHGTRVAVIRQGEKPHLPLKGVDGLVTDRPDVLLVVKHADCVPIFLFDRVRRVIGLVHSGWRGTVGKIGLVALQKMLIGFDSRVGDIFVGIGPGARACCYRKPKDSLLAQLPEWHDYLETKDGAMAVSLSGFIKRTFEDAGIPENQISDCEICTIHNRNYWSWTRQRDQKEERGMGVSVLGLK